MTVINSADRFSLYLGGTLTVETPLSITRPDQGKNARSDQGMPLLTMTVVTETGAPVKVPVIPGETVKGVLRRSTVEVYRSAILGHPDYEKLFGDRANPWGLDDLYLFTLGGVKGSEKEDRNDLVRQTQLRQHNPILSLFGASTPWVASRFFVDPAIAVLPGAGDANLDYALPGGTRRDPFRQDPNLLADLTVDDREQWLEQNELTQQASAINAEIKRLKGQYARLTGDEKPDADAIKAAKAALDDAEKRLKSVTDNPTYSNAVNRPLPKKAAIAPGTKMTHAMGVNGGTLLEIGLFLDGLAEFAVAPRIGGHRSVGHGRVSGDYEIKIRTLPNREKVPAGTVTISESAGLVIKSENPVVAAAMTAWAEAKARILDGSFAVGGTNKEAA
jgi:CRISPR type IV-associated protein Csf2